MAPSATTEDSFPQQITVKSSPNRTETINGHSHAKSSDLVKGRRRTKYLLDRSLKQTYPAVRGGHESWLDLEDERQVFDSAGGAAVACLGYNNKKVIQAIHAQLQTGIAYLASSFWSHGKVDELCEELIAGTGGKMSRVYLTGSGSEAMEATLKLSRQYFYEQDHNTRRINFISRQGSYHGNTLGALSVSGHTARRAPYLPMLMTNVHFVSACNAYRQRQVGESDSEFVARKVAELETKFQELGPATVVGFIAEPVVGAALGCVPSVPGYLAAMRQVCHRHGALFILDEVMSGMGRCGTLHAWQEEDVVPDLQTIGKGLAAGYQPVAAVLMSERVVNRLRDGTGQFIHGQTFQGMPCQAAAALEVQRIVRKRSLVNNVATLGAYLGCQLKLKLDHHPNVGDIRGRGFFWGLEFVQDKDTKQPFPAATAIAQRIHDTATSSPFNITLYPGTGTADGILGDHVIISPPYIVNKQDIDFIVSKVVGIIERVFLDVAAL